MIRTATCAAAIALAMTGVSFAQTTGPSGQQDTNKPGMANPGTNTGMSSGAMTKSNNAGNQGNATTPGPTTGPSGQTPKAETK